jgi:hypothetical protein
MQTICKRTVLSETKVKSTDVATSKQTEQAAGSVQNTADPSAGGTRDRQTNRALDIR